MRKQDAVTTFAVATEVRVRYAETDAMGVAHHTSYLVWFEVGRTAYTRAIGMPYHEIERSGVRLVVVAVSCRYHAPARYDDVVVVRTALRELKRATLTFAYDVRLASDGRLLADGETVHAATDLEGRVMRIPEDIRIALAREGRNP